MTANVESGQIASALTLAEARGRAAALGEYVQARAAQGEELRRLPDETIEQFVSSDLMRMNQARRWGGSELGAEAVIELVSAVAEGDGASGWVFGLFASHFWLGSLFSLPAQQDMWGEDPSALMSSSFVADQSACEQVADGYRVSGRWPFSSGSDFGAWAMVGIAVGPPDGGSPISRWCLVPRSEYRVEDTWRTCALRGTGSNTIVIKDAFVPEYRTVDPNALMSGVAPGAQANPSALFRLPLAMAFSSYLAAVAAGVAARAVNEFVEHAQRKVDQYVGRLALADSMINHIGQVSSYAEAGQGLMCHRAREVDAILTEGRAPTKAEWLACNRDYAAGVRLCVDAVDLSMRVSGAGGLFTHHSAQQCWRDVHGVAAHRAFNPDKNHGSWGRHLLGLPQPPGMA